MLVERTVLLERVDWLEPEAERVASEVLRAVLPVLRLVLVFWSTVPVERLVVAVPVLLRLVELEVELPVLRLVRVFWSTVPAERVVEEEVPVERLVVAVPEVPRLVELEVELPVLRLVRSF